MRSCRVLVQLGEELAGFRDIVSACMLTVLLLCIESVTQPTKQLPHPGSPVCR
jgi:hypothetical protein